MHCACYIAESDDKHPLRLNPCPEHERWARAVMHAEREACAKVAEADTSFDMLQDFGMQSHSAQLRANIAEAIRNRT